MVTVLFSVEPSHSPSGTLMPSVVIPSATTQQRPFSSIASSISTARRTSCSDRDISAARCSLVRADELAADRRLRGRALGVDDVLADRLARAREAARRDAGEHLLQHHPGQRVAIGEVRVGDQRHLAGAVSGPGPRTLNRDAPPAERDLARLMAMAHRGAVRVARALRAHDIVDLLLEQLGQHAEPGRDAQRQQPLLRCPHQLAQRLLHPGGQHGLLQRSRPARPIRSPSRRFLLRSLADHRERSQPERTRRRDRRLQVLRATGQPPRQWRGVATPSRAMGDSHL